MAEGQGTLPLNRTGLVQERAAASAHQTGLWRHGHPTVNPTSKKQRRKENRKCWAEPAAASFRGRTYERWAEPAAARFRGQAGCGGSSL